MTTVYCARCKQRITGWQHDRPPMKTGDELGMEEGCRRGSGVIRRLAEVNISRSNQKFVTEGTGNELDDEVFKSFVIAGLLLSLLPSLSFAQYVRTNLASNQEGVAPNTDSRH